MRPGFFIPYDILKTNYYTWILNSSDKCVLQALWQLALFGNNKYYNSGLLVVNASVHKIAMTSGVKSTPLRESLARLDQLGVIVKSHRKMRNNRYFVGFRVKDDDRLYLLDYLISEFEPMITEYIEEQMLTKLKKWQTPMVNEKSFFKLKKAYKDFICDNIDNPSIISSYKLKDDKNMYELLFNRQDIYRQPLMKTKNGNELIQSNKLVY